MLGVDGAMNFSALFEAIAITAGTKQAWPAFEPGKAWVTSVTIRQDGYGEYEIYNLEPSKAEWPPSPDDQVSYTTERITLKEFWTGSKFMYMGYGPHSNTLVIGLMRD